MSILHKLVKKFLQLMGLIAVTYAVFIYAGLFQAFLQHANKAKREIANCQTERAVRLPDFIGIGVPKCGTGALAKFINFHPQILVTKPIETYFFNTHFEKGLEHYASFIPKGPNKKYLFEKTPNYFVDFTAANRIRETLPNAKCILVLCDPVKRSFSDFVENNKLRYNKTTFPLLFERLVDKHISKLTKFLDNYNKTNKYELINALMRTFPGEAHSIWHGFYNLFLHHWEKLFGPKQLLILNGDKMLSNPGMLLRKVQRFLGVPESIRPEDFEIPPGRKFFCLRKKKPSGAVKYDCLASNKGRTRSGQMKMSNKTVRQLTSFYERFNYLITKF